MDLAASLRGVPQWAWYTSAGVAIAGVGIYTFRNRATDEDPGSSEEEPVGYGESSTPSPIPGIVVPDINFPADNSGQQGFTDLHTSYITGLEQLMALYRDQAQQPPPEAAIPIVQLPDFLDSITAITGGGAASSPGPAGVVTVAPPKSKPKDPCTGKFNRKRAGGPHKGKCFRSDYRLVNVRKKGKLYCQRQKVYRYADGSVEVIQVMSTRNKPGKC